ncbi:uncharacterized protein BDR25DRAFT_335447 [Lindgomyces ingoldianus]|uniref:Uncharacterized protein n=1 Tax=Lindgomyces ingoldianus TaxID=673940 RepID=A0ACB6QQH7_9PLEO|nr:uncharacterized protein BDR25DRAFT_335447 [Lindgomyces ingoldianus]KAF2468337.1 hypothetical protein BDR25DRAFT_335447 [Lindgomyces ingoldianus]
MPSNDPFQHIVVGYPKLAAKIEIQPEAAIFRKFGALNAQNLLYFQAELTCLEQELRDQQLEDDNDRNPDQGVKKCKYAKSWDWLRDSQEDGDTTQLDLVLKIRETLKEYNHALLQQSMILNLSSPGKWDLHNLQDYLQAPEMGPLALEGEDATIWGSVKDRKSHKPDLVALCPRRREDAFSSWVAESAIVNLFRCGCARFMKPSRIHGVVGYEDSTIYRITYWITSILASLIPIASIVILYCVYSMRARLGIIAAFNLLVAVCLMGLANAKRAEVFAITAA